MKIKTMFSVFLLLLAAQPAFAQQGSGKGCTPPSDFDKSLCGPEIGCGPPAPGSDCTAIEGDFLLNEAGHCCQQQCVFVNSNGGPCAWDEDAPTKTEVNTVENQVGEKCTPGSPEVWDEALCGPEVWCSPPAPGSDCTAVEGEFLLNEAGHCCKRKCVFVNSNGERCTWDDDVPTSTEVGTVENQVGEKCTPKEGFDKTLCGPQIGCAPPAPGSDCTAIEGDFLLNEVGHCCQQQCVFVNSNGGPCTWGEDMPTITEVGIVEKETGEKCTPPSPEVFDEALCGPEIGCAPPALGSDCTAVEGDFFLNEEGHCCQQQCVFVNSNGAPYVWDKVTSTVEGHEDDNNSVQVGDMCSPPHQSLAPVSSTTKQAIEHEVPDCPVARCSSPPVGCEYKMDHHVINVMGDCCPEPCYAVDSEGRECLVYDGSGSSSSGSGVPSLWLTSSFMTATILLLAARN